jgi:hypothetical protein
MHADHDLLSATATRCSSVLTMAAAKVVVDLTIDDDEDVAEASGAVLQPLVHG